MGGGTLPKGRMQTKKSQKSLVESRWKFSHFGAWMGAKWVWIDAEFDSASRARRSRKARPFARSAPYGRVARVRRSARGAGLF